jgi:cell division protein FtsL
MNKKISFYRFLMLKNKENLSNETLKKYILFLNIYNYTHILLILLVIGILIYAISTIWIEYKKYN